MMHCPPSKLLLAGSLAAAAWSSAYARPAYDMLGADNDHVTFSSASSAGLAHKPAEDDGDAADRTFSGQLHETSFVDMRFAQGHASNGLQIGHAHDFKFEGKREPHVQSVPAIPEPSTYALLGAGLACIAMVARRHRPRNW